MILLEATDVQSILFSSYKNLVEVIMERFDNFDSENVAAYSGGSLPAVSRESGNSPGYKTDRKIINKSAFENRIKNHLLASQTGNELLNQLPYFESVWLSSRQCIYSPFDSFDYIYFPETAVISESQVLEDGRTVEIAMIGNEGATSITSLTGEQTAINSVNVLVQGQAHRIKTDILKEHFFGNQSLQYLFCSFLQNYTMQISTRVACAAFHTVEQRLACWLLSIQSRSSRKKIDLTHEIIADALGTNRPTISNIAVEFKNKKLIDYSRGQITLVNQSALERTACECGKNINVI